MNNILIFGLGILCGMVLQTLLIFIYGAMRANNIDKDK